MYASEGSSLSRRAVLGCVAGLTAGLASPVSGAVHSAQPTATPTVLTQNAYVGVDLTRLLRAESLSEVRRVAGALLDEIDPAVYRARADAIAGAIEATGAAVVALQEVTLLRTQDPSDFGIDDPAAASDVRVDFLADIQAALDDRGLGYRVAAATATTDLELPADTDDGPVDLRLTDRDVLLVRTDLDAAADVTATYEAALPVPIPETDRSMLVRRGFCAATVTMDGVAFTAVSTHLEAAAGVVREAQAEELLDRLPTDRPVVLCGDFNSGPGGQRDTYDLLTASFTDPYAVRRPEADGFTCCQAADLTNDRSQLDRRVDAILYRGAVQPTAVGRVGHRPDDRVTVDVDGETTELWPSDHAGVVATLEIRAPEPTATATQTPTATPTQAQTPTEQSPTPTATDTPASTPTASAQTPPEPTSSSGPGFGLTAALAGLLAGGYGALKSTREHCE